MDFLRALTVQRIKTKMLYDKIVRRTYSMDNHVYLGTVNATNTMDFGAKEPIITELCNEWSTDDVHIYALYNFARQDCVVVMAEYNDGHEEELKLAFYKFKEYMDGVKGILEVVGIEPFDVFYNYKLMEDNND